MAKGDEKMAETIVLCSHKGGVGKSTSAACFADLLAKEGNKVLLVDTDSQGNLSGRFGFPPNHRKGITLGDAVRNILSDEPKPLKEFVQGTEFMGIDIIPNNDSYALAVQDMLKGVMAGVNSYKFLVQELGKDYDYILIDTKPAVDNELMQAILASDWAVIPMEAADDSINGAGNMLRFVKSCKKGNPNIKVAGLFFNAVDMRTSVAKAYVPQIQESWKDLMFKTVIPYSQDAKKAEGLHAPVTDAFPNGKVALAFKALLKEVEERVR